VIESLHHDFGVVYQEGPQLISGRKLFFHRSKQILDQRSDPRYFRICDHKLSCISVKHKAACLQRGQRHIRNLPNHLVCLCRTEELLTEERNYDISPTHRGVSVELLWVDFVYLGLDLLRQTKHKCHCAVQFRIVLPDTQSCSPRDVRGVVAGVALETDQ
jgi:hypothetical protein